MKRLLPPAIIAAAALAVGGIALAARDSDDSDYASPTAPTNSRSGAGPESTPIATVNVTEIDGLGAVLADAEGRVLYTPDEEAADPDVLCTDACEEFWAPLEAGDEAPTAASGVTDLDVTARPDGTRQVTVAGRRLYTFTLEGPGEASGDDLSDNFGDQRFTWRAVLAEEAGGAPATGTGTGTDENSSSDTVIDSGSDVFDYPGY